MRPRVFDAHMFSKLISAFFYIFTHTFTLTLFYLLSINITYFFILYTTEDVAKFYYPCKYIENEPTLSYNFTPYSRKYKRKWSNNSH